MGRKDWKLRKRQMAAAAVLALAVSSGGMTALAVERPETIDEETWARLQDYVLEYDEIANLVEYYNPQYQQLVNGIQMNLQPVEKAASDLHQVARDSNWDAYLDQKDGDQMSAMINKTYARYASSAASTVESLERTLKNSTKNTKNLTRKSLISGVQQLMIGYNQAAASIELASTAVELAQEALESAQSQRAMGMATDTDVQSAQKSLFEAQSQLQLLTDTTSTLRQQMCMMTGYSYDAPLEVRTVPEPDLSRIDAMNPETDYNTARQFNPTISALQSVSGRAGNYDRKFRTLHEGEAQLKTKIESMYQEVLQARTAYEAANTALAGAQLTMDGNERMYQLGMLGRLQYLQTKLAYLQQKSAADNASLSLTQAIEAYYWALNGVVEF